MEKKLQMLCINHECKFYPWEKWFEGTTIKAPMSNMITLCVATAYMIYIIIFNWMFLKNWEVDTD